MKRMLSVFLTMCLLLSLTACGQPTPAAPETAEAGVGSGYPVEITDQAGRTVTIEKKPERIVSGYYISTSACLALGLQEKLVGIEASADKRPVYRFSAPRLLELPSVGTIKEFDLEGCMALEPDLVILPLKLKSVTESLEQLGLTVLFVNPESQELLAEMIGLIGRSADVSDRAEELNGFLCRQAAALSGLTGVAPTVYLGGNSAFLSTAGDRMYQSDLIRLAGGINAAAEIQDTYWAEIDYEQLLAWDPDYIVLASNAAYTVEDVLTDPNLTELKAVKNGHVLQIPGKAEAWDSPVPGSILGAVWLASQLHPQEFTPEQGEKTIDEYYETFYGFTYSQQ